MSVLNLDRLLAPRRVAVIGAGAQPTSVGHIVLRNLIEGGFGGAVYPVNPKRQAIGGVPAYPDVAATPETPDLAVVCTPAAGVPEVVGRCGAAGVPALAVISAGFRETGASGLTLERDVAAAAKRFDGMRILGPNCLGLLVPRLRLNASFSTAMPADGSVALITQSGALATSMIDWSAEAGVGFSHLVSVGNMLDVDLGDLIDQLARDAGTSALVLYIENVTDPRKFMSAARAFALSKPIVAYKAGRFAASAAAAVSHTGAMVGEDAVYDAALARTGIERVDRIEEVFGTVELLTKARTRDGGRLAIVTNAGGPGVIATDVLLTRGGTLAELGEASRTALGTILPGAASASNPVDILGDAGPDRYRDALEVVVEDPGVDAVLAILTPQAMTDPTATAHEVARVGGRSATPLLAAWLGGRAVAEGARALARAGISTYPYPEQAVDAFVHLASYRRNLDLLRETPRTVLSGFESVHADTRGHAEALLRDASGILSEAASKELLNAYGIAVTEPHPAHSAAEAAAAAAEIGYPVALKVRSAEITHKTDVGGVALDISTAAEVEAAFERIIEQASQRRPEARIDGVTVQRMVTGPGNELLLGAHRDPTFGAVIAIAAGGLATEVLADRSLGFPPLNERLARRMLEALRIWPLLTGYRDRPAVDLDDLIATMIRFSHLVADHPDLAEIEVNPLLATPSGSVALDARAVLERGLPAVARPPFPHLAIRPYPEELRTQATTASGLEVVLRAIRPEDEPLWQEMLDASSADSIRARFRGLVGHPHQTAARYCFIDYDRELALVAEHADTGRPRLAGVGRLVADPDHERGEFAILVADPWQGRGLGDLITERCLEVAADWGLEAVYAETTPENRRMVSILESHGFDVSLDSTDDLVVGERATRVRRPRR